MKAELLRRPTPDGDIVRLYDFTSEEVARLRDACCALYTGEIVRFDLHAQPWVINVNGFRLSFGLARYNRGLVEPPDGSFAWLLKQTWWNNVEGLVAPFVADPSGGFNWIDANGGTGLLLSCDGSW